MQQRYEHEKRNSGISMLFRSASTRNQQTSKRSDFLKSIMEIIEGTYMESEEYLLLEAEMLLEVNEWTEAIHRHNMLIENRNELSKAWNDRIDVIQEKNQGKGKQR
jgi:hypothetical protein